LRAVARRTARLPGARTFSTGSVSLWYTTWRDIARVDLATTSFVKHCNLEGLLSKGITSYADLGSEGVYDGVLIISANTPDKALRCSIMNSPCQGEDTVANSLLVLRKPEIEKKFIEPDSAIHMAQAFRALSEGSSSLALLSRYEALRAVFVDGSRSTPSPSGSDTRSRR
jgi:hypothetical protein